VDTTEFCDYPERVATRFVIFKTNQKAIEADWLVHDTNTTTARPTHSTSSVFLFRSVGFYSDTL